MVSIHWFRQDLRLADNPALRAAVQAGTIIPLYIFDNVNPQANLPGAASQLWLHHSLANLQQNLGGKLLIQKGDPLTILPKLCEAHKANAVYWNRCYEPWQIQRDTQLKTLLTNNNVAVHTFNGSLLWEPWTIKKTDGTPYKVFTPFYRKGCLMAQAPRMPESALTKMDILTIPGLKVEELKLTPQHAWQHIIQHWTVGEAGAWQRLQEFITNGINQYKSGRNYPAKPFISRLSPHLHFGEISPQQVWYAIQEQAPDANTEHFLSELGWREFSYSLLYFNPELPTKNLQTKFDAFPWQEQPEHLKAWQSGQTGIPMVDAGMRELWQTGFMHNRVRMIVGSFLVKNLQIHWHAGERWFWNTLFDADLANNSAGWQWIAGCGADAAPYFRVFNPITQGEKFDPEGEYVRLYVPELAKMPDKYLFAPWLAPPEILAKAGVKLGQNYPKPIVDLKDSRTAALAAYDQMRAQYD